MNVTESTSHTSEINEQKKRQNKRLSRKEQKARKKLKATTTTTTTTTTTDTSQVAPASAQNIPAHLEGASSSEVTAQNDEQDYDTNYIPTSRTLAPHKSQQSSKQQQQSAKSLGKWFPKAVVLKSSAPPSPKHKASIVLFYQYINPLWPESYLTGFISYLCHVAENRCLGGRIRVAREGVNATISSRDTDAASAQQTLRHFARDLQGYHEIFKETDFKYIDGLNGDRHFKDFKVFPVQELVFYGLPSDKSMGKTDLGSMKGGVHLSAQDFHQKLTDPETVVIDVRNHYEAMLGRFDGQQFANGNNKESDDAEKIEGTNDVSDANHTGKETADTKTELEDDAKVAPAVAAEYIDPRMRKSTDWTRWLEQEDTKKKLEGKQVLLYCTGGIRCERASVYLNHKLGDKVNGIYQLKGGIERYFKAFPDGGHWRGKNFVFDKREAVDVKNPDGDGGVITNETKTTEPKIPDAKCCRCDKPWDRYVGKKKCNTCGVPVLVCDACLSHVGHKKDEEAKLRCPLCVEEKVTVAASDVEFTANGMSGKAKEEVEGTAAPSVLKWGGGHASLKKDKRRFKTKPCRFGADCRRKDCFFAHPMSGKLP